jgi:hypothetical protein
MEDGKEPKTIITQGSGPMPMPMPGFQPMPWMHGPGPIGPMTGPAPGPSSVGVMTAMSSFGPDGRKMRKLLGPNQFGSMAQSQAQSMSGHGGSMSQVSGSIHHCDQHPYYARTCSVVQLVQSSHFEVTTGQCTLCCSISKCRAAWPNLIDRQEGAGAGAGRNVAEKKAGAQCFVNCVALFWLIICTGSISSYGYGAWRRQHGEFKKRLINFCRN